MKKPKKPYVQFLIISFLITYICFGAIIVSQIPFIEVFSNPIYLILFLIGSLAPFISAVAVHIINKESLGGIRGFINRLKKITYPNFIYLIPLFLIAHYGLAMILRNIYSFEGFNNLLYYIPIALVLLGSQELGWRGILQPGLEKDKGYWKSIIATGLFWSLWFLPLLFIPGFIILPQFYLQFSIYLVGLSFLLSTVYRVSGSILYAVLLSTLIFTLYPIIVLKQNYMLLLLTVLQAIIASIFKEKVIKLN